MSVITSGTHVGPSLVCPVCRGDLQVRGDGAWRCPSCCRTYPEVAGIPDFRVRSDRYLSLDADRRKSEQLAEHSGKGFEAVVAAYWAMTPDVPAVLAARYAARAADGVRRGAALLAEFGSPSKDSTFLDVGCGTGGTLVAAAKAGAHATGVDIALRWLVAARELVTEHAVSARLVAADGATLPFRSGSFDRVVCLETVEHAEDQRGVVQSALLAAAIGGQADVVVANRFSLAPEPVAGLWGVGFLPRRLQAGYVKRRRGTRYQYFRALSRSELTAIVGARADVAIRPGPLPVPPPGSGSLQAAARKTYEGLAASSGGRFLTAVGPYLRVTARPVA